MKMTRYSVQPRDQILVKSFRFFSFAENSKNISSKYSQKILDHGKQSSTDAFKTVSQKQFKKQQKQLVI